jgi:hypothetical protein
MAFRKFGTFRTPHGWLTTTGDGELLQRGTKRGESTGGGGSGTAYVTAFGVSASIDGDNLSVDVNAGTVNSVGTSAVNLTFPIGGGWHYILIRCNASPAPANFPTSVSIVHDTVIPVDSDSVGYIAAALVTTSGNSVTVTQMVTGGLRAERHKYSTPNTASYYYYRV